MNNTSLIVVVCAGVLIAAIFMARPVLMMLIKLFEGQSGELQEWHLTIEHGSPELSADDFWTAAMLELDLAGAQLIREWASHAATGDRINREYTLTDSMVLLELDRWNGCTISGQKAVVEPIAMRAVETSK